MKTAYINENGIRPWTDTNVTTNEKFTTTTLIDHNFNDLWKSWCDVAEQLSEKWIFKREWKSISVCAFNSKTEEYLFKKNLLTQLEDGDFFQKNEDSNIYSMIKNRPSTPQEINNLALEGSNDVLLILQETQSEIDKLWESMLIFEKKITAENIENFLDANENLLICRFYEEETHATSQLMYSTKQANEISSAVKKCALLQIENGDVSNYINHRLQKTSPP
ncbi:hypothetical protein [Pseudomonas costantinii]|uniref:hypothetical protein n=1 Tax=Pseudomonas costantinii TaxID=168469 RepID=UPI0015A2FCBE|nr:hypothetical protein [Pseudomonas costantinii]NVZ70603.1 hypothetical protein [Pseudomonas costantinii]